MKLLLGVSAVGASVVEQICHAISTVASDDWCQKNCNANPPYCPPSLCQCGGPSPVPTPQPTPEPMPTPTPSPKPTPAPTPSDAFKCVNGQCVTSLDGTSLDICQAACEPLPSPVPSPVPRPTPNPPPGALRGKQWYGYWEDWCNENEDVTWWDDNTPGHCNAGCVVKTSFFEKAASYNTLSYAFSTLMQQPKADQGDCSKGCPVWDGRAIYREKDVSITESSTVENPSASVVSMSDFCRFSRQFPGGPKRCIIGLGGWSDWTRLGSIANAQKLSKLVAKLVLHTFADGIELDFEHLAEYNAKYGDVEVDAYIALVQGIRSELDAITSQVWIQAAEKRIAKLNTSHEEDFNRWNAETVAYLQEVIANGPPRFELVYTTRFNAFRNPTSPLDWEKNGAGKTYITDDEGQKLWPALSLAFDTVNIMSYDQDAGMELDFKNILTNFHVTGGVPMEKLNIGFEPGEQGGGGTWEGQVADLAAVEFVNSDKWGGAMIWGVNPDKQDQPEARKIQAAFVSAVSGKLQHPAWPWGTAPVYTPDSNSVAKLEFV